MIAWPAILAAGILVSLILRAVFSAKRRKAAGYQRRQPDPVFTTNHQFDPDNSPSFRGGAVNHSINATMPLVSLTLDEQWAHLYGTGGIIDVWIPRDHVESVVSYRTPPHSAIRFQNADGAFDGIIFWTMSPKKILIAFEQHGWPT